MLIVSMIISFIMVVCGVLCFISAFNYFILRKYRLGFIGQFMSIVILLLAGKEKQQEINNKMLNVSNQKGLAFSSLIWFIYFMFSGLRNIII